MRLDFTNKNVLVTGASRGIGKAIAEAFSQCGANLILVARNKGRLEVVAQKVKAREFFCADVSSYSEMEEVYSKVKEKYGFLDVVVNNAGISPHFRSFHKTPESDWDEIIGVNLKGVLNNAKLSFELLKKGRDPVLINVASVVGLAGAQKIAVYCATKAAVVNFTKALSIEWASYSIRVVGICPGYVKTDMTKGIFSKDDLRNQLLSMIPMRRFADPPEIANVVLFAASSLASYITGSCIIVDGGLLSGL